MDKNKFWLGGRLFNTTSPRLGAPTKHEARPQDGHPNATQGTSASWAPKRNARHVHKLGAPTHVCNANARHVRNERHIRKLGAPMHTQGMPVSWAPQRTSATQTQGTLARPQVGRPNATQGTSARWSPKRKTNRQRKHPHKGALGQKTSWRMDKNKFWLGCRLFNTASPWLGTPMQRKARPQDGRINATQGTSASWAPQRNARHVRKLGAPTHVHNANARHVKNGRHVRTSASWAPQRNARHFRKMVAQTQNSSATKTYTQGSTRQKDELEDG
jgi:hypothetical protein